MTHKNELPGTGKSGNGRRYTKWVLSALLILGLAAVTYRASDPTYLQPPAFLPVDVQLQISDAHTSLNLWHQRALLLPRALLGDAESQFQMAETYQQWIGYYDDVSARDWYARAAEQGHTEGAMWASVFYAKGQGRDKNYALSNHWSEVAARLDPKKYARRYRNVPHSNLLSEQIVETSKRNLESRVLNPLAEPIPGTFFRDCAECPEMVVVPGIDGGTPFAISRTKISLADVSACVQDAKCFYTWPRNQVPDSPPSIEPAAPATILGTNVVDYAYWLFLNTGYHYRLPSQLEWQWAADASVTMAPSAKFDRQRICRGWNEPGLGMHDWVGKIVRGQGPGVYSAPETPAEPNPFELCDTMGPLGELAVACELPHCAGSLMDNSKFVTVVLKKSKQYINKEAYSPR